MYIQQIYTNCLAQASYYLESNGEAAIIDPLRDPNTYIELAQQRGARIRYILETHFHADFVSGHLDLSQLTGAEIVFGPDATPSYPARIAKDKERLPLGDEFIEVLHTPGHTIESACFLTYENDKPHALFSGDTLFIGDVGRPDLLSGNFDAVTLASRLYDSLYNQILPLPDDVLVYPGHGAGSACGKNLSKETISTIGEQRRSNYALQLMSREDFIQSVTEGQPAPPAYFFRDAKLNKTGYQKFSEVKQRAFHGLHASETDRMKREGTLLLDTRTATAFADAHIPGSVNIGLDGDFAVWTGTVIPFDTEIILITEKGKEEETITRLARVGYDNIRGYLNGGIEGWKESGRPLASVKNLSPEEFAELKEKDNYVVLDVRRPAETSGAHLKKAVEIPLNQLPERLEKLDPTAHYLVCCAGGYRSMIAVSLLEKAGFEHVLNVSGGVSRLKKEKPELVETV